MTARLPVLVLGVGGNVSQGILKAIAMGSLPCRVVGACVSPLSYGLYTTDTADVSPAANDPAFMPWLVAICRREGVRAILSGVEAVLRVLAAHHEEIERETGARVIVSGPDVLAIGDDKLVTARWLAAQGCHAPRTVDATDTAAVSALVIACGFPLIAKPRVGKGHAGVLMVHTQVDLAYATAQPGYLVQEYLGSDDTEYTVGCYSDRDGQVRGAIVMRRELQEGTTYKAEIGDYPAVRTESLRIAAALRPMGPSNMQLRITDDDRPVCFEINVRFSGTTPMRAHFGFNDVEAALRHYVLDEPASDLPHITAGVALRYWNELYVDPAAVATLRATGHLTNPAGHPRTVELYGATTQSLSSTSEKLSPAVE